MAAIVPSFNRHVYLPLQYSLIPATTLSANTEPQIKTVKDVSMKLCPEPSIVCNLFRRLPSCDILLIFLLHSCRLNYKAVDGSGIRYYISLLKHAATVNIMVM